MGTAHRAIGFGQLAQQPLHFVLLQRHVDLDGRMARNTGRDIGANLLQVQRLLVALELLDYLVQQMLDIARRNACCRGLYCDGTRAERLDLKGVAV